jgi:hypothetical protein
MQTLMSYLTGFGLAGGVGAKAFIPVLALGAFHYTDYFELSPQWAWIASPAVMVVLGLLVLVELVVDANPDLGQYSDLAGYLPKVVAGFIAFAAATGAVDQSLVQLGTSGLLGGATAGAVHFLRNRARRPLRDHVEHLHSHFGRAASLGEAGVSATAAVGALVAPVFGLVLLVGLVGVAFVVVHALDSRRVACVHCGAPIRPDAVVCRHCKREQRVAAPAANS